MASLFLEININEKFCIQGVSFFLIHHFLKFKWLELIIESVSYEFGLNPGIITYTFAEDNRPEMQEDSIALGFITTKSDAVLLKIISGVSTDYIEIHLVRCTSLIIVQYKNVRFTYRSKETCLLYIT